MRRCLRSARARSSACARLMAAAASSAALAANRASASPLASAAAAACAAASRAAAAWRSASPAASSSLFSSLSVSAETKKPKRGRALRCTGAGRRRHSPSGLASSSPLLPPSSLPPRGRAGSAPQRGSGAGGAAADGNASRRLRSTYAADAPPGLPPAAAMEGGLGCSNGTTAPSFVLCSLDVRTRTVARLHVPRRTPAAARGVTRAAHAAACKKRALRRCAGRQMQSLSAPDLARRPCAAQRAAAPRVRVASVLLRRGAAAMGSSARLRRRAAGRPVLSVTRRLARRRR